MHWGWGGRCQVGSGELRESQEPCSEAWQVTHSTGPSPSPAFFTVRIQVSHQAGQPNGFPIPSCPSWSESLKGDNSTQMAGDSAGGATWLWLDSLMSWALSSRIRISSFSSLFTTGSTWASWKAPVWTFRRKGGWAVGRPGRVARCLPTGWLPWRDVARKECPGTDRDKHNDVEVPAGMADGPGSGG